MWFIVGNDSASGDDGVFALMSFSRTGLGGVVWWFGDGGGSFFLLFLS